MSDQAVPEMVQQFLDSTECTDSACWISADLPGHHHVGGGWGVASRSWVLGVRWTVDQYAGTNDETS